MFRVIAALFLLNIIFLLTDGLYEQGGGIQATQLDGAITESSTVITVDNTTGFAAGNQTITIGLEDIYYTSKDDTNFYTNVAYRGYNDTEAAVHADGSLVFTSGAALVNMLGDYDITTTETGAGASGEASGSVIQTEESFWSRGLPKMFAWNYGIFQNEDLKIIQYCLIGICGILTVIIAMKMLPFVNFS